MKPSHAKNAKDAKEMEWPELSRSPNPYTMSFLFFSSFW
jgi:hypothetical protein